MSFDLGSIVSSVANSVVPGVTDVGGGAATDQPLSHEPVHAHLAPDSNPAATAERQGIIVIGGHEMPAPPPIKASNDNSLSRQGIIIIGGDVPLHPAVAPAVAAIGDAPGAVAKGLGDVARGGLDGPGTGPKPAPEGSGFSGFLHTIANLGRG